LRTGEVLTTPVSMDIVQTQIEDCFSSSAAMVIFNVIAEKAKFLKDDPDTTT